MSLGFVPASPTPATPTGATTSLQLRVSDALVSARRLWLRGRLLGLPAPTAAPSTSWWNGWRSKAAPPPVPLSAHLETQIAGKQFEAEVPLGPHGTFEALFPIELPPARRGWRIARNLVRYGDQTVEACAVVRGAAEAGTVTVVLLPRADTLTEHGGQNLARSPLAAEVTAQLRRLHANHGRRSLVCYVGCVPPAGESHAAELALAATSLGWPAGNFVLLPADTDEVDGALARALDRLRWLFAGSHELQVVNLDPEARALVAAQVPAEDRAEVRSVFEPPDAQPTRFGPATDIYRDERRGLRHARAGRVTRYPIVFCHGMLACTMLRLQLTVNYNYFGVLQKFFEERGFRVLFPRVTPTGGVVERAGQLREQIRRWTEGPVNLIAHSMGGLDARYMITRLGMAEQVRSLTTVATPHHGTYMADWFRANFKQRVPLLVALQAMGISVDGFHDCRPSTCREFNATTPDAPSVRYFSYAGDVPLAKVTPMLRRAWVLLWAAEGPNDGLVSVQSARWGEYLGSVYADHFAQTPDGLFIHPREDFDSLSFFLRVCEDLARREF
jgi:triacylglycerol lipase